MVGSFVDRVNGCTFDKEEHFYTTEVYIYVVSVAWEMEDEK